MSPEHYFYYKSAILLHPGTRSEIKTLHPRDKIMRKRCRMRMYQITGKRFLRLSYILGSNVYRKVPNTSTPCKFKLSEYARNVPEMTVFLIMHN